MAKESKSSAVASPKERLKELRGYAMFVGDDFFKEVLSKIPDTYALAIKETGELEGIENSLSWFACRLKRLRDEPIEHDGSFVAWSDVRKKINELLKELNEV